MTSDETIVLTNEEKKENASNFLKEITTSTASGKETDKENAENAANEKEKAENAANEKEKAENEKQLKTKEVTMYTEKLTRNDPKTNTVFLSFLFFYFFFF